MPPIIVAGQDFADIASHARQIRALREMTGEQRLKLAFEMWRTACEITHSGIRAQYVNFTPAQVEQELARRIMIANGVWENIAFRNWLRKQ